ncbi:Uncharacterised protein [Lysinibacillus sphaericus]|nr:Uncharacterised protein [Lysinibacillus sphaericus]
MRVFDAAHEMVFILRVIVNIGAVVAAHNDMKIGSWTPVASLSGNR